MDGLGYQDSAQAWVGLATRIVHRHGWAVGWGGGRAGGRVFGVRVLGACGRMGGRVRVGGWGGGARSES